MIKFKTRYRCEECKARLSKLVDSCYACGEKDISKPYTIIIYSDRTWWNPLTWTKTIEKEII